MNNQEQSLSIDKVAKILGVAVVTLRRWEKLVKLTAKFRTFGQHRRYFIFIGYVDSSKVDDSVKVLFTFLLVKFKQHSLMLKATIFLIGFGGTNFVKFIP